MYKNIGKKIKGFSYFLAWVIIAVSSFYAFYRVFLNGFSVENTIVSGCIILGGCILAIILSWFIYAFGEIAQKAQEQNENLETLILLVEDLPSKIKAQSNKKDEVPLFDFKTNTSKTDLYSARLKKLKTDYEMSRITYDEYEERKKKLQAEYK